MPDTHRTQFVLGRTRTRLPALRAPWYVTAEVRFGYRSGEWETVEHGTVTDPTYVAVMFAVGPRVTGHDWSMAVDQAGNVAPEDRRIILRPDALKMTDDEVDGYEHRHIVELLWREWATRGINAGCDHQGEPTSRGPEGDPELCPKTGYKYGSKWLVKPLDEPALERVALLNLTELATQGA